MKSTPEKSKSSPVPPEWQGEPMISRQKVVFWMKDQLPLVDCLFVALSLHVILLPIMWILGWALPWPKPPVITTIVEYDLRYWPKVAKPKKVYEVIDPELNKK